MRWNKRGKGAGKEEERELAIISLGTPSEYFRTFDSCFFMGRMRD